MILSQPPTYILLKLHIILISLIIYKPSTLIISPQTFSIQLGAGILLFCLSQCAIPFCILSMAFYLQQRILGKIREELETMERKKIIGKKNRNDHRRKRNQERKIRSKRMNRRKWQQDGQYSWPILRVVGKFLRTRKLKREIVS